MRYLISIFVLMLAACSSTPEKVYYQLPVKSPATQSTVVMGQQNQIWLQRIMLADVLTSNGITYQTSDVSYNNASSHLWASPLEQQLGQSMVSELSSALPGRLVSLQPLQNSPDTLDITLTSFNGRYDGKVLVQGFWTLSRGKEIIRRNFDIQLEQKEDGYPELVRTLADGWQQVASEIAKEANKS
ncbi:membrane integrity-associated transporter subunit PqiC [Providencia stuartii]|uniref:membrane integrity-associated transporter subunit PqiC n=1 Tax=Providencia TaxID=586 RepID=UPI000EF917DC|nr:MULTISPECIES: membrane integrity-associated transporter subunit PqiC [Providencia]EMF0916881.1 membrane integrity-associated transporter subunit PqiC [Providencia stuartii]MCR4078952.1 membrane integrity-associated transporter subunit PqiC [Providencia stuartii]MTC20567.1 membrane integrity-associated transporter subunit PqiC [Providencia stuartii]RMA17720.1 membrane integrity-associated transporter subunit PqiC [Providencia stuartii]